MSQKLGMVYILLTSEKGRSEIAISTAPPPPFRGLLIHFYSTNLKLNDIFHLVLRVKGVLCCEHAVKVDRFLDPIIPIFY